MDRISEILGAINEKILDVFKFIACWLAGLMTIIILLQVCLRYFFDAALPWPEEMARFQMVWLTFLVAPYAYRKGLNVNMDVVVQIMPVTLRTLLAILIHGSVIVLAIACFNESLGMMGRGSRILATTMPFNMVWVYLIMPISFVMMVLVGIESILKNIACMCSPELDRLSGTDQDASQSQG